MSTLDLPIHAPPGRRTNIPTGWLVIRLLSFTLLVALCVTLFVQPDIGLRVFWKLLVPTLPLLFLVAPGLWRNACPVAAANQLPRVLGFTRALETPRVLRERGYLVGIALLLAIIPTRRALFDHHGTATAVLLIAVTSFAFIGGTVFTGKSGWCSTVCPMLPIERLYGQTPFVVVRNSHCEPCVGCAKHCYDADPLPAYRNDMRDDDDWWRRPRRLFAGAFPGVVVAYFLLPEADALFDYLGVAAGALASLIVFRIVSLVTPRLGTVHPAFFAVIAINAFYWFGAPALLDTVAELVNRDLDGAVWPERAALATLTLLWLVRTLTRDRRANRQTVVPVTLSARSGADERAVGSIRFADQDANVTMAPGESVLQGAERCGLALAGSCRVGMCGADPIAVLDGSEHLVDIGDEESKTLRRMGLPAHARMACSAQLRGTGTVYVSTNPNDAPYDEAVEESPILAAISAVVIIGNGVAGVTAAEEVRRLHPDCDIHLIGREAFPFYNRMAISRIVYDRNAMSGLTMKSDEWYDKQRITCWINTQVRSINRGKRNVELATGEVLAWDRLILATGSQSNVPSIPGADLQGVFVLREASDALALRAYAQEQGVRRVVVIGGGLLGLEAAYALHQLGIVTTVLEGADRLLPRFVDEDGAVALAAHFDREGIDVRCGVTVEALVGQRTVEGVHIGAHSHAPAELVVICAGIAPNTDLARATGIAVNRGIIVDASMRTSASGIFAAGDAAEFEGGIVGLWATAQTQAAIAARNALGACEHYVPAPPAAVLKGAGIELTSVGRITPELDDIVLRTVSATADTYSMMIIDGDDALAGAVMIGHPAPARLAVAAMHGDRDPGSLLTYFEDGPSTAISAMRKASWPPPLPTAACTRPSAARVDVLEPSRR